MRRRSNGGRSPRWYGGVVAWRQIKQTTLLSIEEAREELRSLVKGLRQYGVRGGPIAIGEHEPEAVMLSRTRHELIMALLERHGGLEELAEAERRETPTDADVARVADQLGVDVGAPQRR